MSSLKIDYVTDLNDGWGALNFVALQLAIADVGGIVVDLELRPYELYPDLPPEGLPMAEHFARNFGAADATAAKTREALRAWAAELDFDGYRPELRERAYSTFDGHRLLRWALSVGGSQAQQALAMALLRLTLCEGGDVSNRDALLVKADDLGLDVEAARTMLASDAYADEVKRIEGEYRAMGIDTLPVVLIEGKLVSHGSQSPEFYAHLIRQAAAV